MKIWRILKGNPLIFILGFMISNAFSQDNHLERISHQLYPHYFTDALVAALVTGFWVVLAS